MHSVAPVVAVYKPGSHPEQLEEPDPDALPASQALHTTAPSLLERPAVQLVQLNAPEPAKRPEAQAEQLDAPVEAEYLPESHALHEADPSEP